ncbi:MAG: DNA repair protein RecO [Paludibacteraceae bacterium]|nr:DNA repair protein RecO [Paludibacteraceae bacterium]
MPHQTQAIVLTLRAKGDNSSLMDVYTRESGRATYLVYGQRWKSTLQPMSVVSMTVQQQPNREIGTLVSAERVFVPQKQDVKHHCMYLFMAEALEKSLRHPLADDALYDWLIEEIKKLDLTDELQAFPSSFMTRLSELLGYGGAILDEWRYLKSLDIIQTIY